MTANALDARSVRRWLVGTAVNFSMLGFGFGVWLGRLPAVRDHLEATTLQMSLYGLCVAAGSLVGLSFSGRTITWLGARRSLAICVTAQAAALLLAILLLWAGLTAPAAIALFLYGVTFSTSDVAVNVSAAEAERAFGRPRMPLLHGFYSLGGFVSTGLGSAAEAAHIPVPVHAAVVLTLTAVAALMALRWVQRGEHAATADEKTRTGSVLTGPIPVVDAQAAARPARPAPSYNPWRDPRIYLIGLIALSMSLAEGTGADWLSLALVDGRGLSNSYATLMVSVFFVSMMAARAVGSPLLSRFGRVTVIRASASLCALGVLLVILVPSLWVAAVGAVFWGAGCALAFPVAVSAAADEPSRAIKSVAAVSAIAYGAFLIGPMIIGVLGDHFGLLNAFWPLFGIALLCVFIAGAVRRPETAPTP